MEKKHQIKAKKKKKSNKNPSVVGSRVSFLHHQKQTHKRTTLCLSHPKNTQRLNVSGEAGQAFIGIDLKRRSHCDTPSVGGGQWGLTRTAARCEVHLCGRCCGIWILRLRRRWIAYRCLCQHGPIRNQMHMQKWTQVHTHTISRVMPNPNLTLIPSKWSSQPWFKALTYKDVSATICHF